MWRAQARKGIARRLAATRPYWVRASRSTASRSSVGMRPLCAAGTGRHRGHRPVRPGRKSPVAPRPRSGLRPGPVSRLRSRLHPGRVRGRLGAALHTEFGKQTRHVVLDGLLGEVQLGADLAVGEALADQVEDPALLGGEVREPVVGLGSALTPPLEHARGGDGVQERLPGGDVPYGRQQLLAADGLQGIAGDAGHDRVEVRLVVGVRGQHQALDGVVPGADLAAHLHAAAVREPYVEHRDVGPDGRNAHQRVGRRAGLADHPISLSTESISRTPRRTTSWSSSRKKVIFPSSRTRSVSHTESSRGLGARDNVPLLRPPARL